MADPRCGVCKVRFLSLSTDKYDYRVQTGRVKLSLEEWCIVSIGADDDKKPTICSVPSRSTIIIFIFTYRPPPSLVRFIIQISSSTSTGCRHSKSFFRIITTCLCLETSLSLVFSTQTFKSSPVTSVHLFGVLLKIFSLGVSVPTSLSRNYFVLSSLLAMHQRTRDTQWSLIKCSYIAM